MSDAVVVLFGEAERGRLQTPYFCSSLQQLFEYLGEPPEETVGLYFAVQALLFNQPLLYFRVEEEGQSLEDYKAGIELLRLLPPSTMLLRALFLPKVGSEPLISECISLCKTKHSLLLVTEPDFYDYLTHSS
jgi:hypothetical protein